MIKSFDFGVARRAPSLARTIAASLLVGVTAFVGLRPTLSEARRDHGAEALEQLVALAGENRELTRRLAATEDEIDALRGRLAAVEASSGKPKQGAPTTNSRDGGGTPAPETVIAEAAAFRKKVLKALAPELEGIDGRLTLAEKRLAATVTKSEYAKHKHTFSKASYGWAPKPVIDACDGCLLPYLPPSKQGATAVISTSEPK